MKRLLMSVVTAALATVSVERAIAAPSGPLVAGAAKVDITPPVKALNPGDTIRDPLYARAIFVGNGQACAVLVGLDQGGARVDVVGPATLRIAQASGCPAQNIIISATHTHSGSTGGLGGAGEPNPKRIEDAIVAAVVQAKATVKPAKVGYATANVDLNVNRDLFVNNKWRQAPNPEDGSDKTLAIVEFLDDASGVPIGLYMNYAMHPVNFYLTGVISADFPGEASRYVERRFGPDAVAIFSQGASGNQNPRLQRPSQKLVQARMGSPNAKDLSLTTPAPWNTPSTERNSVIRMTAAMGTPVPQAQQDAYKAAIAAAGELVTAEGVIIGETAINALRYGVPGLTNAASIVGAQEAFECPGRDRLDRDDPIREGALPPYADGAPVNIKIGVLRIGDIYLNSVNGEVYNDIAMHLKAQSPMAKEMMVTLANGAANSGYIYSNAAASHLTFQVIGSRLKPGCAEDKIIKTSLSLIDRVKQ